MYSVAQHTTSRKLPILEYKYNSPVQKKNIQIIIRIPGEGIGIAQTGSLAGAMKHLSGEAGNCRPKREKMKPI